MRTSLPSIALAAVGCLAFLVLQYLTNGQPTSPISSIVNALGPLYGTLLFATGILAMYSSLRTVSSQANALEQRKSFRIAFIPTVIGLVGVVHGYLSVLLQYAYLPAGTDLSAFQIPHSAIWATLFIGGLFTMASLSIMTVVRFSRLEQKVACTPS